MLKNRLDWLELAKKMPWVVLVGLVGVVMIMAGLVSMLVRNKEDRGVEIISVEETATSEIIVDVGGAVINPGVYQLGAEARVNDALVTAGGLAQEADRDWVEKNLNLAQKLTDGQKLYIPVVEEKEKKGSSLTDKININMASVAELDRLWGVGEATAKKIIENRPYGSVEELLTKKIIKSNVYEEIKDEVAVY